MQLVLAKWARNSKVEVIWTDINLCKQLVSHLLKFEKKIWLIQIFQSEAIRVFELQYIINMRFCVTVLRPQKSVFFSWHSSPSNYKKHTALSFLTNYTPLIRVFQCKLFPTTSPRVTINKQTLFDYNQQAVFHRDITRIHCQQDVNHS